MYKILFRQIYFPSLRNQVCKYFINTHVKRKSVEDSGIFQNHKEKSYKKGQSRRTRSVRFGVGARTLRRFMEGFAMLTQSVAALRDRLFIELYSWHLKKFEMCSLDWTAPFCAIIYFVLIYNI